MHNHPSRNARGKKSKPSKRQEKIGKDTLTVYFALAFIFTFFIGSITYDFWKTAFPAIDSINTIMGLLAPFGITVPTMFLGISKQKKGNITALTLGLYLGIFLLVVSRSAGYEVQLSTPSSEERESEETSSSIQG